MLEISVKLLTQLNEYIQFHKIYSLKTGVLRCPATRVTNQRYLFFPIKDIGNDNI